MGFIDYIKNKKIIKEKTIPDSQNDSIRLCYIAFERFQDMAKLGKTYEMYNPYKLPEGMSMEDACKVVSYLSKKVEYRKNIEPASRTSVQLVNNLLKDYGFNNIDSIKGTHLHSVEIYNPFRNIDTESINCQELEGVTDLFTIGGEPSLFRKSKLNDRYFDWFTPNVSHQEIYDIYKKIGQSSILDKAKDSQERS